MYAPVKISISDWYQMLFSFSSFNLGSPFTDSSRYVLILHIMCGVYQIVVHKINTNKKEELESKTGPNMISVYAMEKYSTWYSVDYFELTSRNIKA